MTIFSSLLYIYVSLQQSQTTHISPSLSIYFSLSTKCFMPLGRRLWTGFDLHSSLDLRIWWGRCSHTILLSKGIASLPSLLRGFLLKWTVLELSERDYKKNHWTQVSFEHKISTPKRWRRRHNHTEEIIMLSIFSTCFYTLGLKHVLVCHQTISLTY